MARKRSRNLSSLHHSTVGLASTEYWVLKFAEKEKDGTFGSKTATAFWAPKATKSQAPHETLFTILLHPAPMNTRFTSTSVWPPLKADDMVAEESERAVAVTLCFSRGRLRLVLLEGRKKAYLGRQAQDLRAYEILSEF